MYIAHTTNPEVSVLMPCYNASRWLREAIDSVLAQTFVNFELILVDGGSTDETLNIIKSYCDSDGRIVAIFKKKSGLVDSLNEGITHAKGAWIARLDADDLCEPTRLEEQVNFTRNHPDVVLLGTGFIEIDEHGRVIMKYRYPYEHRALIQHQEHMKGIFPHSSVFFKRKTALDAGCYNSFFLKTEDLDFWLRLAEKGIIACLPKYLVRIRRHSVRISNSTEGFSHFVYITAAIACHFLRISNHPPPSIDNDNWLRFLKWIESRMKDKDDIGLWKSWADTRAVFFSSRNRFFGTIRFVIRLIQSGHAFKMVWRKIFGSSFPKRLAGEWIRLSCDK